MNTKKGISPLIATVLLIGFSVALAAVIMTWGFDYMEYIQIGVGKKTQEFLKCSDLAFEITNVDCSGKIIVQNNGNMNLVNITLRTYAGKLITSVIYGEGIAAFANREYQDIDLAGVTKVEAFASVETDSGEVVSCDKTTKEYVTTC